MVRRHLRALRGSASPRGDDFTLIKGIGPAIKARLHDTGILAFAQLGASSPEKIAAVVASLSAKRIARENWIGQARKLASRQKPAKRRIKRAVLRGRQHYGTFTVELLLNEDNEVRRTRVTHIQSGAEDTWARWDDARLASFIVERAALRLPLTEPPPRATAIAEHVPPSPAAARVIGALRLRELEMVPVGADSPNYVLRHGQPFVVRLTLDLTEVVAPSDVPLAYEATVCAKKLGGPRQLVGKACDSITPAETVIVNVEGTALPQGIYRLEAVATLTPLLAESSPRAGLMAMLEGGLLQVY